MSRSDARIKIPDSAVTWRFSRSPGPGGQHVNTSNTRVELTCDLRQLVSDEATLARVRARYGEQLKVVASSQRSQLQNRRLAMEELVARLEGAAKVPRRRHATKPTRSSVESRLSEKRLNSARKAERRFPNDEL